MSFKRVVVIGSSAGGVTALRSIVAGLPADFPAPILVTQHIGAYRSILPELLSTEGTLPAHHAADGEAIEPGRIYVAPPNQHLMVHEGRVSLSLGPKENFARPAIDPMFRSAALGYGPAVVGVVLTGGLDDGTAGLQAIKQCGGVAVVQDPATAEEPSMPRSAMNFVAVDHCVPVDAMPQLLTAIVREDAHAESPVRPLAIAYEDALLTQEGDPMESLSKVATPSGLVCPECHGSLWKMKDVKPVRFRCYTGHAYSLRALRLAQEEGTDAALWSALRALDEKYAILKAMVENGAGDPGENLAEKAEEALDLAHRLRRLIQDPGLRETQD